MAVVSQIEVLEQCETVEGGGLDVCDVIGIDPESDQVIAEVAPKQTMDFVVL